MDYTGNVHHTIRCDCPLLVILIPEKTSPLVEYSGILPIPNASYEIIWRYKTFLIGHQQKAILLLSRIMILLIKSTVLVK